MNLGLFIFKQPHLAWKVGPRASQGFGVGRRGAVLSGMKRIRAGALNVEIGIRLLIGWREEENGMDAERTNEEKGNEEEKEWTCWNNSITH